MPTKENALTRKLRGYFAMPRKVFELLSIVQTPLSTTEFAIYLICVAIADWDRKRVDTTYGSFLCSDVQIGALVGRDGSTVNRAKRKLEKLGLLKYEPDRRVRITNYEHFDRTKASQLIKEIDENSFAMVQGGTSPVQDEIVIPQWFFTKELEPTQVQKVASIHNPISKRFKFPFQGKDLITINNLSHFKLVQDKVRALGEEIENWESELPEEIAKIEQHNRLVDSLIISSFSYGFDLKEESL